MVPKFAPILLQPRSGDERFSHSDPGSKFSLLDFWGWAFSDLVNNTTRGVLAEFIVARALGIDTSAAIREDWATFDLTTPAGLKVEVKSAAYLQSWGSMRPSRIRFRASKTKAFDRVTCRYGAELKRHADVYVFCLLKHQDKSTLDPTDLEQWEFYVLPVWDVDALLGEKTVLRLETLTAARPACGPLPISQLRTAVDSSASRKPT